MRLIQAVLVAVPVLAMALVPVKDASACGGCFPPIQQMESTQVSGHRMILSISKTQSTLWDQITYVGNPESFAWVLPIKGTVEVGVSSDALFNTLESLTQVTINSPVITCPPPPFCGNRSAALGDNVLPSPPGGTGGGVTVLAHEVVGPYETVQLASTDPNALNMWLTGHGYSISPDVSPIISGYLAEGFDFLALKLVPGQGIQSMKPVRVTTQGASPVLPLRMVAVGAGATVPITLFVIGEGKYVPSNFPSFTISLDKLIWDWDKKESNYKTVRQEGFAATSNKGWLVEAGEPLNQQSVTAQLQGLVSSNPQQSGYADAMGMGAFEAYGSDMEALFGSLPSTQAHLTRLHAELPKAALGTDLTVEAASDQKQVERIFNLTKSTGTPPACQTPPPCDDGGCAVTAAGEAEASAAPFGALIGLGLILVHRRRKAERAARP